MTDDKEYLVDLFKNGENYSFQGGLILKMNSGAAIGRIFEDGRVTISSENNPEKEIGHIVSSEVRGNKNERVASFESCGTVHIYGEDSENNGAYSSFVRDIYEHLNPDDDDE